MTSIKIKLLACVLLAIAPSLSCKGDDKTRDKVAPPLPAPADAPAAAGAFDKLHVTIAGKPVAIGRALIKRLPIGAYQIFLANQGGSCAELMDNLFNGGDDKIHVLVNTATRLAADGTATTIVSDVFPPHGPGDVAEGSKASVTGTADVGSKVDVSLDFTGKTISGDPIEVHGTFTADGCGPQADDPSGVPKAPHPSTAKIGLGARGFPLVGALRKHGRDLYLSTGPRDCSPWTPRAELRLDFTGGTWHLEGDWLARTYSNSVAPDEKMQKVTIVAGKTGTSPDGPTVQLTLKGAGTIDGLEVGVDGTIEALDCPE